MALRILKAWAGDPSYEQITRNVNKLWNSDGRSAREWTARKNTVADCFRVGRKRLSDELLLAIVAVLNPDKSYVEQWRQALQLTRAEVQASSFATVLDHLPADAVDFVGRTAELDRLARLARDRTEVISAIEGMAGIGKTYLAVRFGHLLLRQQQLDRVMFVNLRGFHPNRPPASTSTVLEAFLRILGVTPHQIPYSADARARLYHSRLQHISCLVVLDNAANHEQIRPLITSSGRRNVTLITSRQSLAGLRHVARLQLQTFTEPEAISILTNAAGDRHPTEPGVAGQIARRLGNHPLALGQIAARIQADPEWTLADHLTRLATVGVLDARVTQSMALSYERLPPSAQQMFRWLSLHPGDDFDAFAASALAGTTVKSAQELLQHLVQASMLQQRRSDRYAFHDLVHGFAQHTAYDEDRGSARVASLSRMIAYYAHTAALASSFYVRDSTEPELMFGPPGTPGPNLATAAQAQYWLDAERSNLIATAVAATKHGLSPQAASLAASLRPYLESGANWREAEVLYSHALQSAQGDSRLLCDLGRTYWRLGRYADAVRTLKSSVRAARDQGDRPQERMALQSLATVLMRRGRLQEAIRYCHGALTVATQLGDLAGEGQIMSNLSAGYWSIGRCDQAIKYAQEAAALGKRVGDRRLQGHALNNLGLAYARLGQHVEAQKHSRRALRIAREIGNRYGEGWSLANIGLVRSCQGDHRAGVRNCLLAVELFRQLHDRPSEGIALANLGQVYVNQRKLQDAQRCFQHALQIAAETGDRCLEATARNGLGEATRLSEQLDEALCHHRAAGILARKIEDLFAHAVSLRGMGHAYADLGQHSRSRKSMSRASTIFTSLGIPMGT